MKQLRSYLVRKAPAGAARSALARLLDEPHAGLDQAGRDIVDGLVRDAVDAGATVLVASHELDRTRTIASRVITIAGGVVVADQPIPGRSMAVGPAPVRGGPDVA